MTYDVEILVINILLTEIACTRASLHLTDDMQVIQDVHRYSFHEMMTMSCTSGFIGTTVRA